MVMAHIFREYRNTVVKYLQFPSHLRKKKKIFRVTTMFFSFLGKKHALQFTFFFREGASMQIILTFFTQALRT